MEQANSTSSSIPWYSSKAQLKGTSQLHGNPIPFIHHKVLFFSHLSTSSQNTNSKSHIAISKFGIQSQNTDTITLNFSRIRTPFSKLMKVNFRQTSHEVIVLTFCTIYRVSNDNQKDIFFSHILIYNFLNLTFISISRLLPKFCTFNFKPLIFMLLLTLYLLKDWARGGMWWCRLLEGIQKGIKR